MDKQNIHVLQANKKGSPVHEAPALHGSGEGSDHLGSLYVAFQEAVSTTWTRDLLATRQHLLPLRQGSPSKG
jgi:hypothetical protein